MPDETRLQLLWPRPRDRFQPGYAERDPQRQNVRLFCTKGAILVKEIEEINGDQLYLEHVARECIHWMERHPEKMNTLEYELITVCFILAQEKAEKLKKKTKRNTWKKISN